MMTPKFLLKLLPCILIAFIVTACGGDDEPQPIPSPTPQPEVPITVSVTPEAISLLCTQNASGAFTIKTEGRWNANCSAEWLHINALSGIGTSSIIITALSANSSASPRTAIINIYGEGDASTVVTVSQMPSLISDCIVQMSDPLILGESLAFIFNPSQKVDYFYFGFLSGDAAGWTDDKIISTLKTMTAKGMNDYNGTLYGINNMTSNTTYTLCTLAFDATGNQGELVKWIVNTPKLTNNDPFVYIDEVYYDAKHWYWTYYPDGCTKDYYTLEQTGNIALQYARKYNTAQLAWLLRKNINEGKASAYFREQGWYCPKNSTPDYLLCVTWGRNDKNEFSPQVNVTLWYDESSSNTSSAKKVETSSIDNIVTYNEIKKSELEIILKNIHLNKANCK